MGGEVRAFDEIHQLVERHVVHVVLPVDQIDDGVAQLNQIMGRDVGGHTHGDARRAVEQQVGQSRRQEVRLFQRVVKVGSVIDGVLVQVLQQFQGDGRQPRLGIAHGRRAVAVDAAEVALAVHQGMAHGEFLGHAHHGVVDGAIAVGVIFAQHFAHDAGALAVGGVGPQTHVVHGVQDAAMHRLQAVTRVRQRTSHDDAHGVIQVRAAHLLVDVDAVDCSYFQIIQVNLRRLRSISRPIRAAFRPALQALCTVVRTSLGSSEDELLFINYTPNRPH